ncbi:ABC transporter permease [Compostibacter hankyongensis]|uniref:ABC transporter permease n=1 Tax=Compostibacter hankyongensis TaxID=1007089 RepID=A0ABP8FR17_9BACT
MDRGYSQVSALKAIIKASFIAILRSPSAVVFTLAFPLIFVLVFGFIGGNTISLRIGVGKDCDTANAIYAALSRIKTIKLVTAPEEEMQEDLQKGHLTAVLNIMPAGKEDGVPRYTVHVRSSSASGDNIRIFEVILRDIVHTADARLFRDRPTVATIQTTRIPGRRYRQIDFILPGMLGFSLLSTGVFGTAFLFFSLRQTLVLKRFFATPVRRFNILLGEAVARLIFQLLGALFLIAVGYFFFEYTLVHGLETVLELLLLSAFGLIIFMGFGFIVSGIARNESTIPPIANIVTMPQFLLAGTFFPIDVFPGWLQPLCRILPLTYLNDALRKVAFEGVHLWNVPWDLLVLVAWGVAAYLAASRVFRWE